jgi:hypothetical protein
VVDDEMTCSDTQLSYPIHFEYSEDANGTILYSYSQPDVEYTVNNMTYTYPAVSIK